MAIIEKFFPNPNSGNKGTINLTVTSASYAATVTSASYALTASYAMNGGGGGGTTTGSFTGSFTGSLNGTASYAITASYASNGGVTQLLAGANITLSPTNGLGQVTITSTAGGGGTGNTATGSYGSFYSTQTQTTPAINTPTSMSFNQVDISNGVSISGSTSSSIKVTNAGVYNLQFSAQLARSAGSGTEDVLIWLRKNGSNLSWTNTDVTFAGGTNVRQVAAWNWFVTAAANDYYELMWSATSTNIIIEASTTPDPDVPSVILTVNRIDQFLSNTGSFTGSFTGNLNGTASNATTASYYGGSVTSASYASTASFVTTAQTASYALSASYATNAGSASVLDLYGITANTNSYLLFSNIVAATGQIVGGNNNLRYNSSTNVLTVGNISATTLTGSLLGTASYASTASYVQTAQTASYVLNAVSSSFSSTASYYGGSVTSASYASTASYVLNAISSSFASTASYAANISSYNVTQSFTNLSTWTFNHNLGYKSVLIQAYDSTDAQIIPQTITLTNTNTATLTFPSALSGYAVATVGGALATSTASYTQTAVSSSFSSTASYVNPLNQNVLLTGSLNISGSGVITNTLTLGKTYPSLLSGDDLKQIFWWPSSISVASSRNVFIGNNDAGSVSTTGWPNIVIGSFTSVALSSGTRNIIFGNYDSLAIATGNRNVGYNTAYTVDVSETIGFNSIVSESNTVTFGNQDRARYSTWYLGSGQSNANGYGIFDMNWYATSVTQGTSNANSINSIWRLNGGRGTGTGNNGDIRLAVALTGSSGANWNSLVDVLNVKGNTGYVGINTISPTHQLTVNGNSAITGSLIVSSSNATSFTLTGNQLLIPSQSGGSVAFTISGSNTKGGAGYLDFLQVTNVGASNPNKYIRLDNTGNLQILRSDYGLNILQLSDAGNLYIYGATSAVTSNSDGVSGSLMFNNNNSQIYDDGNMHIHSRTSGNVMWINTNNAQLNLLAQSPVLGGNSGSGVAIGSGTLTGFVTINSSKAYTTAASYGYLINNATPTGQYPGGSQTVNLSLYAVGRIWGEEIDAFSDERMKDIKGEISLEDGLKLVKTLKPIQYTWKKSDDKGLKAGYSAQQVSKAGFDHLISLIPKEGLEETIDDDGFLSPKDTQFSMNYDQVTPYHGVVIKHLLEKIEQLEEKIKKLEDK